MHVQLSDVNKGHLYIILIKSYEIPSRCVTVCLRISSSLSNKKIWFFPTLFLENIHSWCFAALF